MDVCELKGPQSKKLHNECRERLRDTLERLPVGVAHIDLRGGWQFANHQLCDLLGYDRAELLTRRLDAVLDLDLRRRGSVEGAEISSPVERRYVRRHGEVVWLRVSVSGLPDADNRPAYYVVIVEDISATKASDGALGIVAHELRLPLSHIKGFISTLLRTDVDWDAISRRDFLVEAEHEADRVERLIQDLLDQSTGRHWASSRRTTTYPCALVLTTVARVRPMIGDREVRIDVPSGLPTLQVEVPAMERVLANLLLNASKYSPRAAPIDVAARVVGDMLELRVEDRGAGVPAQDSERIFEPFYRREVHVRDAYDGHGLGLAISRSIVMAHRGRIWVAPRPGGGACFTVALPFMRQATRKSGRSRVPGCASQARNRWPRTAGARPVQTMS